MYPRSFFEHNSNNDMTKISFTPNGRAAILELPMCAHNPDEFLRTFMGLVQQKKLVVVVIKIVHTELFDSEYNNLYVVDIIKKLLLHGYNKTIHFDFTNNENAIMGTYDVISNLLANYQSTFPVLTCESSLGGIANANRNFFSLSRKQEKSYSEANAQLAYTMSDLGRIEDAMYLCNVAIMVDPTSIDMYALRARLNCKLKNNIAAIDDFSKAIDCSSQQKIKNRIYYRRALAYASVDRYSFALNDLNYLLTSKIADAFKLEIVDAYKMIFTNYVRKQTNQNVFYIDVACLHEVAVTSGDSGFISGLYKENNLKKYNGIVMRNWPRTSGRDESLRSIIGLVMSFGVQYIHLEFDGLPLQSDEVFSVHDVYMLFKCYESKTWISCSSSIASANEMFKLNADFIALSDPSKKTVGQIYYRTAICCDELNLRALACDAYWQALGEAKMSDHRRAYAQQRIYKLSSIDMEIEDMDKSTMSSSMRLR